MSDHEDISDVVINNFISTITTAGDIKKTENGIEIKIKRIENITENIEHYPNIVNKTDISGVTALMRLVATNDNTNNNIGEYDKRFKTIIDASKLNVNIQATNAEPVRIDLGYGRKGIINQHDTALMIASREGYIYGVEQLLFNIDDTKVNEPPSEPYENEDNPLIAASREGYSEIVELFLDYEGIEINAKNNAGDTALIVAVKNAHDKVVRELLNVDKTNIFLNKQGIDVNIQNAAGNNALMIVCSAEWNDTNKSKYMAILDMLLSMKKRKDNAEDINLNLTNNEIKTALIMAINKRNIAVVKKLLRFDVTIDQNTLTAAANNPDILKELILYHGTKYNLKPENPTEEIKHLFNYKKLIELLGNIKSSKDEIGPLILPLIDNKYITLQREPCGRTALMEAALYGHKDAVSAIIAKVENNREYINTATSTYGDTALTYAASKGHTEIVKILVNKDNINQTTKLGFTALMEAVQYGHTETTAELLGSDVNLQTKNQMTALMLAAQYGRTSIVKLLLEPPGIEPSIEINKKTSFGENALFFAVRNGYTEIVELLLKKSELCVTTAGTTALMEAIKKGYNQIIELLLEKGSSAYIGKISLIDKKQAIQFTEDKTIKDSITKKITEKQATEDNVVVVAAGAVALIVKTEADADEEIAEADEEGEEAEETIAEGEAALALLQSNQ